jgi:hypothetical protein
MLAIVIFFVAGIVLGLIGLRLLDRWEGRPLVGGHSDPIRRHHS